VEHHEEKVDVPFGQKIGSCGATEFTQINRGCFGAGVVSDTENATKAFSVPYRDSKSSGARMNLLD